MCYNHFLKCSGRRWSNGEHTGNCAQPTLSSSPTPPRSYAPKSWKHVAGGRRMLRSSMFNHTRQKCNQEIPGKSGFILPRNYRELVKAAHWALCCPHFHALHILMSTSHETCWRQRDPQTDKGSGHVKVWSFWATLAIRHLFIAPLLPLTKKAETYHGK